MLQFQTALAASFLPTRYETQRIQCLSKEGRMAIQVQAQQPDYER